MIFADPAVSKITQDSMQVLIKKQKFVRVLSATIGAQNRLTYRLTVVRPIAEHEF